MSDDEQLLDILDIPDENISFSGFDNLRHKQIPLDRISLDAGGVNRYGLKLLELCKRCNFFVANGRICSDQGIGRTTCKNVILVDYLLLLPYMFDVITEFEIIDFNPMFSDVHNRLHFCISIPAGSDSGK